MLATLQVSSLMEVLIDPDFNQSHAIYFCATRIGDKATTVTKAILDESKGELNLAMKVIFDAKEPAKGACKMASKDGFIFVSIGNGIPVFTDAAQRLDMVEGKIIRIGMDGEIPKDNPFFGRDGCRPEIWSYGHRNPEGLAFDPTTGSLWEHEHGPRGGDELNLIKRGGNYGWPVVGHGVNYDGDKIHKAVSGEGMIDPVYYWTPSVAPSGMAFWEGALWLGALKGRMLIRLDLMEGHVANERRYDMGDRIRDIRSGPPGILVPLWVITDSEEAKLEYVWPDVKQ